MDPWLQGILGGVVSNAISTLISNVWRRVRPPKDARDALQLIRSSLDFDFPNHEERNARDFAGLLSSADFQAVVYRLLLAQLRARDVALEAQFRRQIASAIRVYLGDSVGDVDEAADWLLQLAKSGLAAGVGRAESLALARYFSFDDTQAARIDLQLAATAPETVALERGSSIRLAEIQAFERDVCAAVRVRYGFLTPPHPDTRTRIPLNQLYVVPDFEVSSPQRAERPAAVDFAAFIRQLSRTVLLGMPGGGKSTLAAKLAYDLSEGLHVATLGALTPIILKLREYGAARAAEKVNLRGFVARTIKLDYQIEPNESAIDYMLATGRFLLVFDGLDELIDTHERSTISADVDVFVGNYARCRVLVTSREVGYQEAPLPALTFDVFRLAPFSEPKVGEYVEKWFSADGELTPIEQSRRAKLFIKESAVVPDLRANPLMLALLCNIYRGDNYIPRNRPDVFERCATMLFESWDRQRGIRVPLPFQARLRPAMMYLAYAVYGNPELEGGVTRNGLIHIASKYLTERVYGDDIDQAESAAAEFVDFCRGRAWVFTDVGTTPQGDDLYYFTHRTFLEYFAAGYVARTNPSPAQLGEVLFPRIERAEWDVVAQLAVQILDKSYEGAGDIFLGEVAKRARAAGGDLAFNFLAFGARCLEFLVPAALVVRTFVEEAIDQSVEWGSTRVLAPNPQFELVEQSPYSVVEALRVTAEENRRWVMEAIEASLLRLVGAVELPIAASAVDLASVIESTGRARAQETQSTARAWRELVRRVMESAGGRIEDLARFDVDVAYILVLRGSLSVETFVELHGMKALFRLHQRRAWPGVQMIPLVEFVLDEALTSIRGGPDRRRFEWRLDSVGQVAGLFLSKPTPWVERLPYQLIRSFDLAALDSPGSSSDFPPLRDPDAVFVATVIAAADVESYGERESVINVLLKSPQPTLRLIGQIVSAKLSVSSGGGADAVRDLALAPEKETWLLEWVSGKRKLTGRAGRSSKRLAAPKVPRSR